MYFLKLLYFETNGVQVAGEDPQANCHSGLSSERSLCRLFNGVNEAYTLMGLVIA